MLIGEMRKRGRQLFWNGQKGRWTAFKLTLFMMLWEIVTNLLDHFSRNSWTKTMNVDSYRLIPLLGQSFGGSLTQGILQAVVMGVFTMGATWAFVLWLQTGDEPDHPIADSVRFWHRSTVRDSVVLLGLRFIFTTLWTLLFIVPGIVKSYSYSQAPLLYAEDVQRGREIKNMSDYITQSRELMDGYKWKLFCLELSFIGWWFLVIITLGVASIYVVPYYTAAHAEFYLQLRKANDRNYTAHANEENKAQNNNEQPEDDAVDEFADDNPVEEHRMDRHKNDSDDDEI